MRVFEEKAIVTAPADTVRIENIELTSETDDL
jgi:hypothetical protein